MAKYHTIGIKLTSTHTIVICPVCGALLPLEREGRKGEIIDMHEQWHASLTEATTPPELKQ